MSTEYKTRSNKYFLTGFWGGAERGRMFQLTSGEQYENSVETFERRYVCLPTDPKTLDALIMDLIDLRDGAIKEDEL